VERTHNALSAIKSIDRHLTLGRDTMNTAELKAYAPKARRDFIAAVTKQAQKYGVTESVIHPVDINGDVCVVNGKPFPASLAPRINKLGERVNSQGFAQTMEQIAYSWFNRLIAIRYMELNDYLGHGRRVLSHPDHPTGFQILEECTELSYGNSGEAGELPGLTHEKVVELKLDGTKDEELYRELLLAQCHALHQAMPFLFETIDDETELLLPENLTKTDSLIHNLITDLAESNWRDSETGKGNIEVVGWLYQFYISEKKDQVIGKVVKSEDIPAATQLFTPNWIVKYMVQNSLGAQWLATYPESPLKAQMEYYIEPAEQTDEVNAQLKAITPESLNPEELTLIDPASGSGHILVEAYDLFKAIYLERGYRQRDIAQLILEKNLFGLDIDQRAAQLTGFALMMKGREDDRRLFERGVKLNVMAMVDSTSLDVDTLVHGIELSQHGLNAEDLTALKDLFEHATTFGSLIQVPQTLAEKLPALKQLSETNSQDMFVKEVLEHLAPLVKQAEILAAQYDAVVANPPYMGSKYQTPILKKYLKDHYKGYEKDFFSAFIVRDLSFSKPSASIGIVAPYVWMFISSYELLRERLIGGTSLASLIQLEYNAFEPAMIPVATFTLMRHHVPNFTGSYIKLSEFKGHRNQAPRTLEAINNPNCGWLYRARPDDFKKIPSSPVAYWASEKLIDLFSVGEQLGRRYSAITGLSTTNSERFLRLWSEVDLGCTEFDCTDAVHCIDGGKRWFPINKGGTSRRWYGNNDTVLNWHNNGSELKEFLVEKYNGGSFTKDIRGEHSYFRSAVAASAITSGVNGFRYYPSGGLFDVNFRSFIPANAAERDFLLAFLNSQVVIHLLRALSPTLALNASDLLRLPLVEASIMKWGEIERLILHAKEDWDAYEESWGFQLLPLLIVESTPTIEASYITWSTQNRGTIAEMKRLEEENNRLLIEAYGLQDELSPEVPIEQITLTVNPAYRYGVKGTEEDRNTRFREDTMAELVSYAIGCMMGRYSLDEPGLVYANSGNEGFDDLVERGAYTKFPADDDGIIPITDKEWFADDAANRLVEFISVAWDKAHLEENLDFLAANLSPKKGEGSRDTIRRYLCDKFYKDHLQTYKKRPIYWLFSSGKQKAFQCLVYLHRYNESTLARLRTEYVIPLTAKLSAHIDNLESDKLASDSAAEIKKLEKDIKTLQKQQTELTEFDDKLKHFADMRIPLDLDDGVKVNYGKFGDLLAEVKDIHGKKV
jgi:type II restriction/modification system DNA methylase subunit YeeA